MSLDSSRNPTSLVADTGPLLALARIDFLTVLNRLFQPCRVTESVIGECLQKQETSDAVAVQQALAGGVLTAISDPAVRRSLSLLDQGESTAIEAAIRHRSVVLLDERRGRRTAQQHGVKSIGTLGVLLLAKEWGFTPAVMPHISKLRRSGYYLDEALIRQVRALANE